MLSIVQGTGGARGRFEVAARLNDRRPEPCEPSRLAGAAGPVESALAVAHLLNDGLDRRGYRRLSVSRLQHLRCRATAVGRGCFALSQSWAPTSRGPEVGPSHCSRRVELEAGHCDRAWRSPPVLLVLLVRPSTPLDECAERAAVSALDGWRRTGQ